MKTVIVEQNSRGLKKYLLEPKDFGLKKATPNEIATGGKQQNIIDFLRIISGVEKGAKRDLVIANASAAFYILGRAQNFKEGTKIALKYLHNNSAYHKLTKLVTTLGDQNKLTYWLQKAKIR